VTSDSTWERVDEPVLHFVREAEYNAQYRFNREGFTEEVPHLDGAELDDALRRLGEHGLITWAERVETFGAYIYSRLRLAPGGLRVLGEWPPAERAQLGTAVVAILRSLAGDADNLADQKPLRRAAGSVAQLATNVAFDVAAGEAKRLGGDLA
jgi:hypothetical protein